MHVTSERRRATYEDLCKVPDHLVAELIDGELFTSPRPALPHALASSMIGFALIGTFGGPPEGSTAPGGWWILDEPELHFGEDVLVPDLAGWRRERLPAIPDAAAGAATGLGLRDRLSLHGCARPWAQDAGVCPRAGRPS